MRIRRVRGVALLVAGVAVLLAAGCSGGGSAGSGGPDGVEKPNLTVAVVPALDAAGFFIALQQGLFKDQGLNVRFVPAISSDTVISAQVAGQYDITGGNYVSYLQAQQAGQANLDIFAEGSVMQPGAMGIYTMPGSPIKTLADLKGRTVAINAPNNIMYLLAASVLSEHGISPSRVRFVVQADGFPAIPAALKAGAVSAAALPEPYASDAEQQDGAVSLADLNQGGTTGFPVLGYVVTKQWAQKYPHTLAAFYTALEQGQRIADTSRSAVQTAMEALPGSLGVTKDTAAVFAVEGYPVSTGPVGSVDQMRLERVVDAMRQFLAFSRSFNVASMLLAAPAGTHPAP
jgi:NitT/TauT family transport system substrate-binding protein